MAFSKLKAQSSKLKAQSPLATERSQTIDALFVALGDMCTLFEPQDCWAFIEATRHTSDQMQNTLARSSAQHTMVSVGNAEDETATSMFGKIASDLKEY